jgi:Spy/CpxP family protein refolding chaperone
VFRSFALAVLACALPTVAALAQHDHAAMAAAGHSPYAAMMRREIKALSDTQITQYRAGDGMGLALAAELNHYPGPRHVLELADSLDLTPEQRSTIVAEQEGMSAEARRLGDAIVAQERALDRAFAGGTVTEPQLRARTADIARLQGELRYTHLRAHLAVRAVLTPEQVRRYDAMRGYAAGGPGDHR